MKLTISVLPRSSRNQIVGTAPNGKLKVKLTAAPVGGEANKKLVELLSKHFSIAKSKINIVSGLTSKIKVVEIEE